MKGHLYLIDETGAEIPGSRRSLAHCETIEDIERVRRLLESAAGEGCMVLDSEVDRTQGTGT